MPDVFSKLKRSFVMSRIRGKGNRSTELALIKLFRAHGIVGWRRHLPLVGTPDFVFKGHKLAVFVDGCFWHGCSRCYQAPKTRSHFWKAKIERNKARDLEVKNILNKIGFQVIRIKECELAQNPLKIVHRIRSYLRT